MMKKVIFGFLGSNLDQTGKGKRRWLRWRPTIDICRVEHGQADRLELLYHRKDTALARRVVEDIKDIAPNVEINLIEVTIDDPWDFEQVYTVLFDLAKRYPFNLEQEEYTIHITTGTHVVQICWFLLAEARFFPAKLLQASPPNKAIQASSEEQTQEDIMSRCPLGQITQIDLNLNRYDQIFTRFEQYSAQATDYLKSGIATKNRTFNQLIDELEIVAKRSCAPILLEGPTGSGKSFLAKRIYELKVQQHQIHGPFVEVNCATLRGDSAMSTLFGHVKGAFTGAEKERSGLLKSADKGMLFLDEIGELGLDEQAMLLKAIEEKKFYPFGADKEVKSDFQIIAGTHKSLKNLVRKGLFREDLFARINLWHYALPSLAQRKEDIEPNLDYELARFAREYKKMPRFNKEAKTHYLRFATSDKALWQGNFRELTASVTRMATLAQHNNITNELVETEIERLSQNWQEEGAIKAQYSALIPDQLDLFDQCQLKQVIDVCMQSPTLAEAGRRLFAISRAHKQVSNDSDRLRKYLAKFDLSWEKIKQHST
ncbi:RNA repair transcriptional activator RtcR [Neisseria sp. Ec49-e6-T10]|uniref:RNA repair transcriptional activator RtcR n=1 Tax=Neisseria sp. Ec49-e6-T10 TaxID=3140744 RepID=UPI003EC088E0